MTTAPTRGVRRALGSLLVVAVLVVACGGTATPAPSAATPAPSPAGTGAPSSDEPTEEPIDKPTEEPTDEPSAEPTDEPTDDPTEEPTEEPTDEPSPSGGTASACTGSDDNRAFYAAVAEDVSWDVWCPVLPRGWFVESGTFRLSRGGRMEISYTGPGGRRIALRQGAFCTDDGGCPPDGSDAGAADFGTVPARLVEAGDGWVVYAEGDGVAWEATGTGIDGPTLAGITADFALVGG